MAFKPHGIVVPIVTPVTQDGKFNEKAYRDLIEYLASSGIHGVFPFGTTGEFYAHDMGFYREVLAVTKDAVRGRMDIYAGANNITTRGAVEIAKAVEQVGGIDALSVLTPMFVSQTQYEVSEYYREIASETNLPIIIYNNRPKTNVTVEPATVAKLAETPNIVSIKDSSGDLTIAAEYIRLTRHREDFNVLMGRDTLIYGALCYGAAGSIAACANVAPRLCADIYDKYMAGDLKGSLEAQLTLAPLRIAFTIGTFPAVIKESLEMLGIEAGPCMAPVGPMTVQERDKLRAVLVQMGLLQ